ncbi:glycerate kinase type-2 family protein [Bryobacter aggregatus]|uniref:glycerate kinase type-2 family protein n=1 Tax=Bryobacter aggregatus TaxID=360054 RepID=UPI00068BBC9E|nr:glycerate kinase [Bryobacter aggregatus]
MTPQKQSSPSLPSASSVERSLRQDALAIFQAALAAADPYAATLAHLPKTVGSVYVVGAGKAAAAMARAVEKVYGNRIQAGVVVTKYGHAQPLQHIRCLEASHPVPDEAGVHAAHEIAQICLSAQETDLIICLISGGASALLPFPAQPITLEEKQTTTRLLLSCGANIQELNTVRKHLSSIKGGLLADLAYPAKLHTLILSDVIGDSLDVIGSGPTVPDTSTYEEAWQILYRYGLIAKIPASVRDRLEQGCNKELPETPKPGTRIFDRVKNTLIGSNRLSLKAAQATAKSLGYKPLLLSTSLDGEAREAARFFASMAREARATGNPARPPLALLAGGETTVALSAHPGLGGRNQEMALAAAIGIDGLPATCFLAAGTDGTDGPTEAAGAYATGSTLARGAKLDLDPQDFLARNDSYHYFQPLKDLFLPGPTGTNVMDLYLMLLR